MPGSGGVARDQLTDLINTTLRHRRKGKFNQTYKYQYYEVMDYLLRRRATLGRGRGIEELVRITESGTAKHVLPYEVQKINVQDVTAKLTVDFVKANDYWVVSDSEASENKGDPEGWVNLVDIRRADCWANLGNLVEDAYWATPSASSPENPWGIKYWIVARGSAGEGFDGGAPSGFSTVGGINPTAYSRWKNYAAGGTGYYTDVDKTLVRTMRKAFKKIRFRAPRNVSMGMDPKWSFRLYSNFATSSLFEERVEQQNDRLGFDVVPAEGQVTFKRLPLIEIPALESDSTHPIYMVDLATWEIRINRDMNLVQRQPMRDVEQHDVAVNWIDLEYLFVCRNRRRNAIVHQ